MSVAAKMFILAEDVQGFIQRKWLFIKEDLR
ncbi:hypothetical protein FOXG_21963 [Fusarium oxysporum f. sp. lycopersici 4287]|uniref:Uncharacterized protein n=1 Tax=Fusarium oxysporum f. sp. lycopersici (strain 4287 / CBS 123668 / FGSC 9935 / NRRL 34936) TaxID=426428 RepID=A0A0J9W1B6_FUSO4|nr:hypothetical protein FOXG_21722 [Fusarium oxysporum f. sp. lycopersici 4287]XP_018255572.1 hypothetical protein FOXG_21963 [Fusarium oxysporum f. sp. lycopersici 4287]KNB16625.1 hypothetical protein FOXG_21722 [Fusarium oxysporum f. sp. lycopersici 4287]KNB17527.1 hypothetical protein FOXG_21963 [Fusarium oxysporum f. sp. lycopersici 4287]